MVRRARDARPPRTFRLEEALGLGTELGIVPRTTLRGVDELGEGRLQSRLRSLPRVASKLRVRHRPTRASQPVSDRPRILYASTTVTLAFYPGHAGLSADRRLARRFACRRRFGAQLGRSRLSARAYLLAHGAAGVDPRRPGRLHGCDGGSSPRATER